MGRRLLLCLLQMAVFLLLPGCVAETAGGAEYTAATSALPAEQPVTSIAASAPEPVCETAELAREQKLQRYLQDYSPLAVYQDCLLENRYLLILSDRIVSLFLADGFSQCVVLDGGDIVSVEADTVGNLAFLRITDKANATYDITLSPTQISRILQEISYLTNIKGE